MIIWVTISKIWTISDLHIDMCVCQLTSVFGVSLLME